MISGTRMPTGETGPEGALESALEWPSSWSESHCSQEKPRGFEPLGQAEAGLLSRGEREREQACSSLQQTCPRTGSAPDLTLSWEGASGSPSTAQHGNPSLTEAQS